VSFDKTWRPAPALSDRETRDWAEIVSLAEELEADRPQNAVTPLLYDEALLRALIASVLHSDARSAEGTRIRRAREIQRDIAAVLLNDWDPIGISDVPEAADEYDSYVGRIYRLLASGATATDLARHLRNIEVETMGLSGRPVETLVPVGTKLLKIDITLRESSV
jgi:hypothetical protein